VNAPTVLELFAGIGGLSLGLERAGFRIAGQVEIDPFCRSVLAAHWPEVPRHDDVRTAAAWWRSRPRPALDLVAGGFPCQPFSTAGRRRGVSDERWMWPAMAAVIRELRPRYVLVENVAALVRDRAAFGWILGDLAALGFDAEWSLLSACAVGAPHVRQRLFLVAYAVRELGPLGLAHPPQPQPAGRQPLRPGDDQAGTWDHPHDGLMEAERRSRRTADGVPDPLEPARVRAVGNAVVPRAAEHIGRLIHTAITSARGAAA
jgi:DNA (cytosine-5)-methyltransferase 1